MDPTIDQWLNDIDFHGDMRSKQVLAIAYREGQVSTQTLRRKLAIDSDDAREILGDLLAQELLVPTGEPEAARLGTPIDPAYLSLSESARALLDYLSEEDAIKTSELEERTSLSKRQLLSLLRELIDAGLVVPTAPPTSKNRAYRLAANKPAPSSSHLAHRL